MPKIIIDDAKGLYQTAGKGVVGLTQSKTVNAAWSAGASIQADTIVIPANSLITAAHVVITDDLLGAGNVNSQAKIGTTALGTEICIAKNIQTRANSVADRGISTNSALTTALQGSQSLVITAGQAYRENETSLYASVVFSDASNFTGGAVQFTVEFITFE